MLQKEDTIKDTDVASPEDAVKNDVGEKAILRMNRRRFMQMAGAAAAALTLGRSLGFDLMPTAAAFSQSQNLVKFNQPMRNPLTGGIPLAASDGTRTWGTTVATHYSIDIGQFEDQLHPNLPNPTRLWGYGQGFSNINPAWTKHLGGIIVAQKGTPVQITVTNHLPPKHILPVDKSQPNFPDAAAHENDACTHLHGGFVPWISDGGPMAFFDPNGVYGPSALLPNAPGNIYKVLNPGLLPGQAELYYPNQQSARMMWYHDHAHDTTRLNAYAGIATAYVITDTYETSLASAPVNLPGPTDPRTFYLVFQDKIFVQQNITVPNNIVDPTWPTIMPNSRAGDLWYAHVYDITRWMLGPTPLGLPPDPSCIPEYFGDTMLVNGTVSPFLEVEQREYRFRMLNACQARFLNPRLVYAQSNVVGSVGSTEPSPNVAGPAFVQIGSEGGFLPAPAMVNGPKQPLLLVAPAERADFIVDFRNIPAGTILILYNDAPAPFPKGDARNDYYPQNPKTPSSIPGFAPNTRTLLQIRVKASVGPADAPITLPAAFTPTDPFLVAQTPGIPNAYIVNPQGFASVILANGSTVQAKVRYLTLNETFDGYGRLIQYLGTNTATNLGGVGLFGRDYMSPATEVVKAGDYEIWEIANLTGDVHPIHFHLVNGQILSRQAFSVKQYKGGIPNYQDGLIAPDPNELGWKETIRMNPGEVTRVFFKFDLPVVPFTVPMSANPNLGVSGHEYVWHCHILEHEEHDMMRPLVVQ